ncbi:MAG: hypothetical protein QXP72_00090 [Desulfurococcaceae archaeon]
MSSFFNFETLLELVKLSDEVYARAKSMENQYGKKIYEGLMLTLDFRGSSEAAVKFIEIQRLSSIPLVYIDNDNTWCINREVAVGLLKQVDPRAPIEKIFRETQSEPSKYAGKYRLKLGGAWGEIASFYILNEPLPKITNIVYLLHMATYITSFTTVTIPEIYTGSEEFLKLVSGIDKKNGAIEFLTKLMRKRYIPEDQYTSALEAVNKRNDLPFTTFRDILEKYEARMVLSEHLTKGVSGIIEKLNEITSKYGDKPIPREEVSLIVGELYSVVRGLKEVLEEFNKALRVLNDLMTTSGKTISPAKLRSIVEELSRV